MPKISVVLDGDSTSLPKPELAELKVGFLNKLQAESDETLHRTKIVVELSSADPIQAEAVFKLGSSIGIADVHAIGAVLDARSREAGCFVTPDNDQTQCPIVFQAPTHRHQTMARTPAPTRGPSLALCSGPGPGSVAVVASG